MNEESTPLTWEDITFTTDQKSLAASLPGMTATIVEAIAAESPTSDCRKLVAALLAALLNCMARPAPSSGS